MIKLNLYVVIAEEKYMKYFGTDGFRGEANVNLNVVHAYKVGRFLGWYYGREHKARVIIGKDTRRSSYMFEELFLQVLRQAVLMYISYMSLLRRVFPML